MTLWRRPAQELRHSLRPVFAPRRARERRDVDPQDVPLRELFPPRFMEANTSFASFGEMLQASPSRDPSCEAWQLAFRHPAWDEHVRKTTRFSSWKAMRAAAATELRRRGA